MPVGWCLNSLRFGSAFIQTNWQSWEFIKENKKVRKQENTISTKKATKKEKKERKKEKTTKKATKKKR